MDKLQKIRERFPDAYLAINPSGKDGPLTEEQIDRLIEASKVGGPVTFVLPYERLDQNAIDKLSPYGTISIWNSPNKSNLSEEEIPGLTEELRRQGVNGLIDLRPADR